MLTVFLAFPFCGRAQEVETVPQTICAGTTLTVDGQLFRRLSTDVTVVSVQSDQGENVNFNGTVSPQVTTLYTLSYTLSGQDGLLTATTTVTVWHKPFFRIVGNVPAGEVCPGTEITYRVDSMADVDGDIRWTLSTGEETVTGMTFSFIPTESCTLFIRATNNYCEPTEETRAFTLIPPPSFNHPDIILDPPAYQTCTSCTFELPDWQSWRPQPLEGAITRTELIWDNGLTGEQVIKPGYNHFGCELQFTLTKTDACGTIETTVNKVSYLYVTGLTCEPYATTAVWLRPCEWSPVYLYAPVDSAHIRYDATGFEVQPAWDGLEVVDSMVIIPRADDYIQAPTRFLRAYDKPRDLPDESETLQYLYSADYTIVCPYSQDAPTIPGRHAEQTGTINWENEWLYFGYQYCDRTMALLEIDAIYPDLQIDTVWFDGIPADSFQIVNRRPDVINFQTVNTVRTKIDPNIDRYERLTLRVAISRDIDDCHFADTITKTIELTESYICYPNFFESGEFSSDGRLCAGTEQQLQYIAYMHYQAIDSLKIARSGFIVDTTFTATDRQNFSCAFRPYFASPDREADGRQFDTVVFFGYYHDTETLETFRDTFYYEIDLRTCPPIANNELNPDCRSGCLSCPGSELQTLVNFINPSTDPDKIQVHWLNAPKGRQTRDTMLIAPAGYVAQWNSLFTLYEPSAFALEITYNEGDSIRTIQPRLPVSAFIVDPACAPRFEIYRDSCCVGDDIHWYIYADFYKYELTGAEWEEPASEVWPVGAGIEDYLYPSYPNSRRPRLVYGTEVQQPALYPYTVSYTVNDTVLTYRDTLKIAAIENPKIFTQDTLYVCAGSSVDLAPYIDRSVVEEIISPNNLLLPNVSANQTVSAIARMKYTCDHGNEIANAILIFAENDVYLTSPPPFTSVCPLDSLQLDVATNGRLNWLKRRWHAGSGWDTADDTLFAGIHHDRTIFDRVDADSVRYTVVAFTACPLPPQTAMFKAARLPKPEIAFLDLYTCYPEELNPRVVLSGEPATNGTGQWFLQGEAVEPPYAPTYDTLTLVYQIQGANGCWGRADTGIYNYRPPQLQPAMPFCLHAGVEGVLEMSGADAYVWEGNGRTDPNDPARYFLLTARDTIVYINGTDHATGCSSRDTFDVLLYAPRLTQTTDTLCWHTDAVLPFTGDSQTRIAWYFNGPTGEAEAVEVGRDSLRWTPLQMADTGVYTRVSYRAYCVDTQTYRLRLHPVPNRRLQGTDTLCEHESLQLFYENDAQSVYGARTGFVWFAPDGRPLATCEPAETVTLRLDSLRPDDAGYYAMRLTYGDCRLLDSLYVTVFPIPYPGLPADTFLCEGRQLILDAFNPDYPDGLYTWQNGLQPFPGAGQLATAVRIEKDGIYTASLVANGCLGTIAVEVEERPLPVFSLPADTLVCRGEECVFYLPDHYDAYAWYDTAHASAVGTAPQQGFTGSGPVWVEVTRNGCADTASSLIDRVFCGSLYFASAFTPNGNRLNDRFGQISMALPEDLYYELTVFDRNNHIVFHSTDLNETWDGTFRGRECPAGVYVYQCRASVRRDGRDVSATGRIVLIR